MFRNVSFSYAKDLRPALRDVSFRIHTGATVAIVGVNGAGKSTLGRLLLHAYKPDSGQIEIDGIPLRDIPRDELSRTIVTVPQDTALLHTTLRDNITLGADIGESQMTRVLQLTQLDRVIARMPQGLDTIVGHRGLRLSGGQRQSVAIARALLRDPSILLCDEATASLDPSTERNLLPLLTQTSQGRTTILITHRLPLAMHADVIWVLDDGRIAEQGTHATLMARGELYAQLWARYEGSEPVRMRAVDQ